MHVSLLVMKISFFNPNMGKELSQPYVFTLYAVKWIGLVLDITKRYDTYLITNKFLNPIMGVDLA